MAAGSEILSKCTRLSCAAGSKIFSNAQDFQDNHVESLDVHSMCVSFNPITKCKKAFMIVYSHEIGYDMHAWNILCVLVDCMHGSYLSSCLT